MRHHSAALPDRRTGPVAAGWLASCLLHGGLAVTALLFVQRMHLGPQTEPFQWDVAMVAPLSPSMTSAFHAETPAPPSPAHRPSTLPSKTAHSTVRPTQPATVSPVDSPPPIPPAESTPPPQQVQPVLQQSSAADSMPPAPTYSAAQPTLPPLVSPSSEQVSAPQTEPSSPGDSPSVTNSAHDPSSAMGASSPSVNPQKLSKVDYGWLAALMAQWIEGLNKRYPATLRTEGVQGKVLLTAMLHEDGTLSDVRVVRSSGNPALDQVALEDVRNGPPVTLSRPLERSQMAVKFSISYDLKMTR